MLIGDGAVLSKSKPEAKILVEQVESDFVKTSFGASASVTVKVKEGILDKTQPTAMDELLASYNAQRRSNNRQKVDRERTNPHPSTTDAAHKKGRGRAANKRKRGKTTGRKIHKRSRGSRKKGSKRWHWIHVTSLDTKLIDGDESLVNGPVFSENLYSEYIEYGTGIEYWYDKIFEYIQ